MRATIEELFWSRVTKSDDADGCWTHSGSRGSHGYPQATARTNRSLPAHRVSWAIHHGPITNGLWVLHRCNNKLCVRPDHLYLGTHRDNMDDLARAGHPNRKLTDEAVRRVRVGGEPLRVLARAYGVDPKAIDNVRRGVTYRHVA